jgi:hypothetical protein
MNPLFAAAKEVAEFMQARHWRFCVIGGLAVQRWGEPRLTNDADLVLLTEFVHDEEYVDTLLDHFRPRSERAREFALANRVLLLKAKNETPVDIVARQGERLNQEYILAVVREIAAAIERPEIIATAQCILEGKPWRR